MVRPYDKDTDFGLVQKWWARRKGIIVPPELMSEHGLTAINVDGPIACLFMWPTMGSGVCFVGFPIASPDIDKETRGEALDQLFFGMKVYARKLGYNLIWTMSGLEYVKERLKKHGYVVGDVGVDQFWASTQEGSDLWLKQLSLQE